MDPTMKTAMTTAILMISFLTMYHNALRDYVTLRRVGFSHTSPMLTFKAPHSNALVVDPG